MASELNLAANELGITVLQAATPESLEAVVDRWIATHATTHVYAMDMHTTARDGPLYMCITYRKERAARKV